MPNVLCKTCKKQFYTKPYFLKQGWGKYCSSRCQYEGFKTGRNLICYICGIKIYKSKRALENSKSKKYFCSKSCQTKWRNTVFVGNKHKNWKNGQSVNYRSVILNSNIKKMCTLCKTKDKRVLAAHHIDKNRKNNKISNLSWLCYNCHYLIHHYSAINQKFMEALV